MPRKSVSSVATFPGGSAVSPNSDLAASVGRLDGQAPDELVIRQAADLDVPWICEVLSAQADVRSQAGGNLQKPHKEASRRLDRFVESAIESSGTIVWRTRRAFLMATLTAPDVAFVEHLGGMPDHIVSSDVAALLGRLRQQADIHLTVPHAEPWLGKVAMRLNGNITESLWARDLPPQKLRGLADNWPPKSDEIERGLRRVDDQLLASSSFVPPSALHAPGGPVLMLPAGESVQDLLSIEQLAATYGAAAAVVRITDSAANRQIEAGLRASGHYPTTSTYFVPMAGSTAEPAEDKDVADHKNRAEVQTGSSGSGESKSSESQPGKAHPNRAEPNKTEPSDLDSNDLDSDNPDSSTAARVIDLRDRVQQKK